MTETISRHVHILALSDAGVQCATFESTASLFWLPRDRHSAWVAVPKPGIATTVIVPKWLATKHRQLVGDVAYERVRDERKIAKEDTMNDKPQDDGHGALFRNDKKEKPAHPDYRGDVTIKGRKFWVSGWIKEGQKGKYMSLAFRQAEDEKPSASPAAAAKAKAYAPADADPF